MGCDVLGIGIEDCDRMTPTRGPWVYRGLFDDAWVDEESLGILVVWDGFWGGWVASRLQYSEVGTGTAAEYHNSKSRKMAIKS